MESKRIVYNDIQYNILTSIRIASTSFLICLDIMDKKIQYFKQENEDGKIRLTSPEKILNKATEVNRKSLTNKKRVLEPFISLVEKQLANTIFVDHSKVILEFKRLVEEINNCDLKYYMIENASIEPTDESIEKLLNNFKSMNFSKDLNQVKEINNELYYFSTNEEEKKNIQPKEESVTNANRLEISNSTDSNDSVIGPNIASNPFENSNINLEKIEQNLTQTQNIEQVLNDNLNNNVYIKEDEIKSKVVKRRRLKPVPVLILFLVLGVLTYFSLSFFLNNNKSYSPDEIMKKVNTKSSIKEIDSGFNYNEPKNLSSSYKKVLENKIIKADISSLKSLNNNTVGWIRNDFLKIDYPLVRGTSNSYYAAHDYLKDNSSYGWPHVDSSNKLDNTDKNIIIYANSDLAGYFFYYLKDVLRPEFAKDINNQVIKLATEKTNSLWLIFSIYEIPNEDYYLTTSFETDDDYLEYLKIINDRSVHNFDVSLDENDKVLTLSTNKDNENRIVVHAKLIKTDVELEEEKKIDDTLDANHGATVDEIEEVTKEDEVKENMNTENEKKDNN